MSGMIKEKVNELLPVGSVVLLKRGKRKLVIMGIMQIQKEKQELYDYIGVLYPEGYMGNKSNFLFNHDDIEKIVFRGYDDQEREGYVDVLTNIFESIVDTVKEKME